MHLLTLSNLKQNQSNEPTPLVPAYIQERLQLLVKQILLELPVEPILDNYPQLHQWVRELKELSPTLFLPHKKLWVDVPITAKIELNLPNIGDNSFSTPPLRVIEVRTNIGTIRGKLRLFEWAIRHPVLSWQDRVKLWVAAEHFNVEPNELQMIVLALHPTQTAQKVSYRWDSKQHKQTRSWLIATIAQQEIKPLQPSLAIPKKVKATENLAAQSDDTAIAIALAKTLDKIDEIPL